jgi:DNA repair exonuclease SbcCD ATPase subunit
MDNTLVTHMCKLVHARKHTPTCGSVKRFEHAREVKQLQKIEQLGNRIQELEAELAKRKTHVTDNDPLRHQQIEQLDNRIKELEAELAKRNSHVTDIDPLRHQQIDQLHSRIKSLEAELDRCQTNIDSLRLKAWEGQQNEQLHNRIQELESELTQRADEVLKERLRVIVCLVSFPAAARPPASARARPGNPRRLAGGARMRNTERAPKDL